jgi:WD40 repeat protein
VPCVPCVMAEELLLSDERVYAESALSRPLLPRELRRDNAAPQTVLGASFSRRNNIHVLGGGSHIAMIAAGLVAVFGTFQRLWLPRLRPLDPPLHDVPFADTKTWKPVFIPSHDGRGVGALAAHPTGRMLAVADKAAPSTGRPAVYIYDWPSLRVRRVLRGATERAHSDLSFSADGSRLAIVGSAPDFLLSVWDWENERLLLKAKAFAQEVFSVRFSPNDPGRLTTSGTGHIRFWRMASTFTGLKLQGLIGKFGRVDLSDVSAFAEMPDGKVLSGSEGGNLLLWEGGFIKLSVVREGGGPVHAGDIGAIVLDRTSGCFLTAGTDGAIRWWAAKPIDEAEGGEGGEFLEAPCLLEAVLPAPEVAGSSGMHARPPCIVALKRIDNAAALAEQSSASWAASRAIADADEGESKASDVARPVSTTPLADGVEGRVNGPLGSWLALDSTGALWRIDTKAETNSDGYVDTKSASVVVEKVSSGHGGFSSGLSISPSARLAVTTGIDGALRVWDYTSGSLLASRHHLVPSTCTSWAPKGADPSGRVLLAGFEDGVLRMLSRTAGSSSLSLVGVHKPHSGPITALAWSSDAALLASGGSDSTVFFFARSTLSPEEAVDDTPSSASSGGLTPLGFLALPAPVSRGCISWAQGSPDAADPNGRRLVVGCKDGSICCIQLPLSWKDFPTASTTFELPFRYLRFRVALPPRASPKPPDEDEDESQSVPAASPVQSDGPEVVDTPASVAVEWQYQERTHGAVAALSFSPFRGETVQAQSSFVKGCRGAAARASAMWMAKKGLAPQLADPSDVAPLGRRIIVAVDGPGAGVLHEVAIPGSSGWIPSFLTERGSKTPGSGLSASALEEWWVSPAGAPQHPPASEEDVAHASQASRPVYPIPEAIELPALAVYDCACEGSADSSASLSESEEGTSITAQWSEPGMSDTVTALALSSGGLFLVEGSSRGRISIRSVLAPSRILALDALDSNSKQVSGVAAEGDDADGFVLCSGGDGPVAVFRARFPAIEAAARAAVEAGPSSDGFERTLAQAESRSGVASKSIDAIRRKQLPSTQPTESPAAAVGAVESPGPVDVDVGSGSIPITGEDLPSGFAPVASPVDDASTVSAPSGLDTGRLSSETAIEDILDSATYSIQDRKLRAEADERKAAADRKKELVREEIRKLQATFEAIRADMNAEAATDPRRSLTEEQLEIDPVLTRRKLAARSNALRRVENELSYRKREAHLRVLKLRSRFLDSVSVPSLAVRAFLRTSSVSTIRAAAVDPSVASERAIARRKVLPLLSGGSSSSLQAGRSKDASRSHEDGTGEDHEGGPFEVLMRGGRSEAEVAAGGGSNSFADRKRRRLARRAALSALLEGRPGDNDLDPDDEAAVAAAWDDLGDLPLKSSEGYTVPKHLRMDAVRKRLQMLWAEEAASTVRAYFNSRVIALARLRSSLTKVASRALARVSQLTEQLSKAGVAVEPHPIVELLTTPSKDGASPLEDPLECGAFPTDARGTPVPCTRVHALLEATKAAREGDSRLTAIWSQVADLVLSDDMPSRSGWGGWGLAPSLGGSAGTSLGAPSPAHQQLAQLPLHLRAVAGFQQDPPLDAKTRALDPLSASIRSPLSSSFDPSPDLSGSLDAATTAYARGALLDAQRSREILLSRIEAACDGFDGAVAQLARERALVNGDLCLAQLRLLTLGVEHRLLSEMGVRDSALTNRLDKAEDQRRRVESQINDVVGGIASREAEAEVWVMKQRDLEATLSEALAGYPAEVTDGLIKVFRRKIKRRKPGDDDDESSDSDDGFDVSQLAEMEGEEEEDEDAEDVCPPGAPQALYDKVLELRGQRLDQEDALNETNKGLADLRQKLKALKASEVSMKKEVHSTNKELAAFHAEKQGRLNNVIVVAPLRIQQVAVGARQVVELPPPPAIPPPKQTNMPGGADAGAITTSASQASLEDAHPHDDDEQTVAQDEAAEARAKEEEALEGALPSGKLPSSLNRACLLPRSSVRGQRDALLSKLSEIHGLDGTLDSVAKERGVIDRQRRVAESAIRQVEEKAEDLMKLKFGRPVNLEKLDALGTGAELARAQAGVAAAEAAASDSSAGFRERLGAAREALVDATKTGTELLERISVLKSSRASLEKSLKTTAGVGMSSRNFEAKQAQTSAELERLEHLVGSQAAQIAEMRAEIAILRRKDGSVYGPLMKALEKTAPPPPASEAEGKTD